MKNIWDWIKGVFTHPVEWWHFLILIGVCYITTLCLRAPEAERTYGWIRIDFADGSTYELNCNSCHTLFNKYRGPGYDGPPGDGKWLADDQWILWDHSGTSVGYYGSKGDFKSVEKAAGSRVESDVFGHNGNCVLVFKQGTIEDIHVLN